MLPFSYEDRCPDYKATSGYGATNEEPAIVHLMLQRKPIYNGLAIASAGEMTFRTLLPKVVNQLVLIDHSYISMRAFCLKALMLSTLGAKRTKQMLVFGDKNELKATILQLEEHLPDTMRNSTKETGGGCRILSEDYNIRREWFYTDVRALEKSVKKLHLIKLIHGDLLDTKDRAPYDFLYISNALEHTGKMGTPQPKLLSTLVKPDARIMWMIANGGNYGGNKLAVEAWTDITTMKGFRTSWEYRLSTLKKKGN